jgi:hypothetical protein
MLQERRPPVRPGIIPGPAEEHEVLALDLLCLQSGREVTLLCAPGPDEHGESC